MTDTRLTNHLTLEEVEERVACPHDGGYVIRGDQAIPTEREDLFRQLLATMQENAKLKREIRTLQGFFKAVQDATYFALWEPDSSE